MTHPASAARRLPEPEGSMRICFVAHFAYGALAGKGRGHIGGVERQTSLMTQWLAARGHDVSLVCWDEGQRDGDVVNGVRIHNLCRRDAGVPGLRFFSPRWTSLNAALKRADAGVYYQNCGEYVTGQVALWSRRNGRKFVYSVASDPDCMPDLPLMRTRRERVLYRIGLRTADAIIVQTRNQQKMLEEGFGLASEIIPMPCPGPSSGNYASPDPPARETSRVLWLGRIDRVKRPDRFLDVVAACPEIRFDLVGPPGEEAYAGPLVERARNYPNLRIVGPVPHAAVSDLMAEAACLCSTSDVEGFPNTFLEAWSVGIPVISTIDPDGVIAGHGLGRVGKTAGELADAVRGLFASPREWREMSERARRYYMENHHFPSVMPRFELLFRALNDEAAR